MAQELTVSATELVAVVCSNNGPEGAATLRDELSALTLCPEPASAEPQPMRNKSGASPFSTPEPDLVQQLKERPMALPPALSLQALVEPVASTPTPAASKSLASGTSGLLPSTVYTSSYPGVLSLSANTLVPPHGAKAVCGKRAKMEDTFNVQTNFANVQLSSADSDVGNKLPARIASQIGEQLEPQASSPSSLPVSPDSSAAPSLSASDASVGGSSVSSSDAGSCDTLHFFGVYDGHGGVEAAQHCANRLHFHLSTALTHLTQLTGGTAALHTHDAFCTIDEHRMGVQCQAEWTLCQEPCQAPSQAPCSQPDEQPAATHAGPQQAECEGPAADTAAGTSARGADGAGASRGSLFAASSPAEAELSAPQAEGAGSSPAESASNDSDSASSEQSRSDTTACMSDMLEAALRHAFIKTDEEFAEDGSSQMVGSTAVVALVGSKKMWIANCGDSRAVLCRGSKAIQVTDDHKPEREDEAERVEKAGGQVLFWNGHRVMGVLAMSRAIGDHGLRPYVIPEPEITVLSRVADDDFLLLASDGLWDVMTNQEAITLAMRCLQRSIDKGTSRKAAVRVAATVLTRAAVDRGSKDNVTVVIIDLKTPQPTAGDACKQECDPTPTCDMCPCTPSFGPCDVPPTPSFGPCDVPPTPMPRGAFSAFGGRSGLSSQDTLFPGQHLPAPEEVQEDRPVCA